MKKLSLFLALTLGSGFAVADNKQPPQKKPPTAEKKPAPKKQVAVSAENKKKLAEYMGGFKFGMSKDEVLATLSKQLDARYDDQIKGTEDISKKDRLRKDKKEELKRIADSWTSFDGKKTGWDTSIVEDEFAHHTGEAMLERWENSNGKNQRRFFFFYEGKLWKMFISLDVSILPADKKNFDTFKTTMQGQFGEADVEPGKLSWHTDEFDVRAIDKLKIYDALGLAIEDGKVKADVVALREQKAPKKAEGNAVIQSVVDKDGKDHPDVKSNGNAVDAVIDANGGNKKTPKK